MPTAVFDGMRGVDGSAPRAEMSLNDPIRGRWTIGLGEDGPRTHLGRRPWYRLYMAGRPSVLVIYSCVQIRISVECDGHAHPTTRSSA